MVVECKNELSIAKKKAKRMKEKNHQKLITNEKNSNFQRVQLFFAFLKAESLFREKKNIHLKKK